MQKQMNTAAIQDSMRAVYLMFGSIGSCALVMLAAVLWVMQGAGSAVATAIISGLGC